MPRPDEHPQLVSMGPGEETCDVCLYQLFPQASDEICNDCELNPLTDDASKTKFLLEAATRESSFPIEEVQVRHALGSLADQPDRQ